MKRQLRTEQNNNNELKYNNNCTDNTNNRGATKTITITQAFIHYLRFKIDRRITLEEIVSMLNLKQSDFIEGYNKENGYSKCYQHKELSITINYNDNSLDRCALINITGTACDEIEHDLIEIIRKAVSKGAVFNRIDIARDDHAGLLDMDEIYDCSKNGYWSGLFKQTHRIEGNDNQGLDSGSTTSFGSKESQMFLQIYDRAKEQGLDYHWIRAELQLTKERSDTIARLIADTGDIDQVYSNLLKRYINFKIPNPNDTKKSRWKNQPWWDSFVGDSETVRIEKRIKEKPIDRNLYWEHRLHQFNKQNSRLFVQLCDHFGEDFMVKSMLGEGRIREERYGKS